MLISNKIHYFRNFKEQTYKLILTEVEYLLYHGVICIN